MDDFFGATARREPSAQNGFSGNRIDRLSELRSPEAIAEALTDERARLYLFAGDRAVLRVGGKTLEPLFDRSAAGDADGAVLLGYADGAPRLAVDLGEDAPGFDDTKAIDLRSLAVQEAVSPEHLGAIAQARSLLAWHQRHRFCANCGAPTAMALGGYRRDCAACGGQHFPRVDPVAIMLVIAPDACLLGRQPPFAERVYSCLAGFIEPGETIEDAVRREIGEEAGIAVGQVRYYSSQPWPFPSSLMIGCHAEAKSREIRMDEAELEDCRWFDRAEVRRMLADTHESGLRTPPPIAIAHRLIRAWAEAE